MKTNLQSAIKGLLALAMGIIVFNASAQDCVAPGGWTTDIIGAITPGQQACETDGVITITAAGKDIYGSADEFVYVHREFSGDGWIIAKVESQEETDEWAKAGVMIRDDNSPGSKFVMCILTPLHGALFEAREIPEVGFSTGNELEDPITSVAPYWVKLERTGGDIIPYVSDNGTDWTEVYLMEPRPLPMNDNALIGLAVTSHSADVLCEAVFSNVSTSADAMVGVESDFASKSSLTVYPNPSTGQISVSFEVTNQSSYTLEVRNMIGQSIYEELISDFSGSYNTQLSLSDYAKGIYIVSLSNGAESLIKKVAIQ